MSTITQGQVGVVVVAGAGTLKSLVITMPLAANVERRVPLTLIDSTAAVAAGPLLYSATISDLESFMYMAKPTSVPLTPGGPTAPALGTLFLNLVIPFTQGLYVKSCPANATFTFT